jgi:transposase
MVHVTLMTGPARRRRWGAEDRRQILMAAFSPGAIVADVSRQFGVATGLIYKWRREVIDARAEGQFVPAVIVDDQQGDLERTSGGEPAIVVELAGGVRVTIGRAATAPMVSAALRALR